MLQNIIETFFGHSIQNDFDLDDFLLTEDKKLAEKII
jgi:hypothetical protein